MPRCASVTSPGRGRALPPPTSAATDAVWCGDLTGGTREQAARGATGGRVDLRDLQRLVVGEAREHRREPASDHRLPDTRRTAQQEVMATRRGGFEPAPRPGQPADLAEIEGLVELVVVGRRGRGRRRATAPPP